ncbi:MetQ/NlpA family ABC transporter substrate-binding protein [Streptomyces sp. NPDC007983]|uniref:MetQ/NlpA family ABC transporter substrate-binding protein n=1 Tax=Streptomyces sp. NPDC007983 TaxID=3364800 RepID=UPI0036E311E5
MRNVLKTATTLLAAAALAAGASACAPPSSGKADKDGPLLVGANPVPHAEILNYVKGHLAKKAGLKLEIKEFTDYNSLNPATQDGSVDANYFQNKPFLDDYNKKRGTDIVPVVTVHLEPLGLYSHKVKKADDLKKGATVAVPNDAVNEARALQLLDAHGVIKLKKGAGTEATPKDIADNPKDLKFKELEAPQLPRSLDDVDAAVINGNYAIQAHLKPAKEALILESPDNSPYGNFLAVKKGNEDDPRVKKLAKLLTSPQVKKFIKDKYDGSVLASF